MYRVISNLDDPTQYRQFDNFFHIFDPRLNHPFPVNPTPKQLINALTVFWNRESILAHPDQFFSLIHQIHPDTDFERLIAPIPDDKLWMLAFISFYQMDDNYPMYQLFNIRDRQNYGANQCYFYCSASYGTRAQYSYRGSNWPTEINDLITTWYNSNYAHLISALGDRVIHPDAAVPSTSSSRLSPTYMAWLLNYPVYHDVNGGALRAAQAFEAFTSDPSVTFEEHPDSSPGNFYLLFKQLVSRYNKTPLYRMMTYSASPITVLPWPLIAKGEHDPVLYGVELELATDYTVQELIDATDDPFFIVKSDGSVTGNRPNKYELATVPMSFKAHKRQWAYWFSKLDYEKFDTSRDTNNGMHVHIGKTTFADAQHISNFAWFFTQPAHLEFMKFFSHRDNNSWVQYSATPDHRGTRVNAFRRNEDRCQDMRGCIHFSSKGTIEVRLFRGIVSLADVIKNLEFVDSIFEFTSQGQTFIKLSLKEYVTWLHKQPKNKFTIIKKYLENTHKLKELIEGSELLNLIFNEKSPQKILSIVAKAGFKVTNEHVTALNRRWKKRIFILKDGQLILNPGTQSELSFLDRLLEKKILHPKANMSVVVAATRPPTETPPGRRPGLRRR